jgi:hypothetical protein
VTFFLPDPGTPPKIKANAPAVDLPDTFDGLGAAFTARQIKTNANAQRQQMMKDEQRELAKKILPRLGTEPGGDFLMDQSLSPQLLERAREAATANPEAWADLDLSDEAVEKSVDARLKAEYEDAQQILEMMPENSWLPQLAGDLAASVADVRNIPFLLFGGGGGIARVAMREAALNMAAEAVTMPSQFDMAKRLDIPDPDVATELALAAAAGAVLGGGVEAAARGWRYYKGRQITPNIGQMDSVQSEAMVNQVEDILSDGRPQPLQRIAEIMDQAGDQARPAPFILENPINPQRPPLLLENPVTEAPVTAEPAMPPAGQITEAPLPADEVVSPSQPDTDELAAAEAELARVKSQDTKGRKPFTDLLRKSPLIDGQTLQIHPDGPFAEELRNMGITSRSRPGLFSRRGQKDLDNLVASEWDELLPGIREAAGVSDDGMYLDRQGLLDVIGREFADDLSWLRTRQAVDDMESVVQDIRDGAPRTAIDDFEAQAPREGSFFVNRDAYGFGDDPDGDIEQAVRGWMDDNGWSEILSDAEQQEIISALQQRGGDPEYLVERALEREVEYVKSPEVENNVPFDEPDQPRGVDGGGSGNGDGQPGTEPGQAPGGRAGDGGGAAPSRAAESTSAGDQTLIDGVAPITARDRLTAQQNAPMRGGARPMDDGLFDLGARQQMDMFSDPTSPEARVVQDAVATDLRAEIEGGARPTVSSKTVDGVPVQVAKGTFTLLHGYSGRGSADIVSQFSGERYDGGSNVFGNDGIYLDGDGKWTANDADRMMFSVEKVAQVKVDFQNALILSPETVPEIARAVRQGDDLASGAAIARWAKENRHDGIIITGFDEFQSKIIGDPKSPTARFQEAEKELNKLGIVEEVGQDQVVAFDPGKVRVVRDGLSPGADVQPVAGILDQPDAAGDFAIDVEMLDGSTRNMKASELLDYLDEGEAFSARLDLCGKGPA